MIKSLFDYCAWQCDTRHTTTAISRHIDRITRTRYQYFIIIIIIIVFSVLVVCFASRAADQPHTDTARWTSDKKIIIIGVNTTTEFGNTLHSRRRRTPCTVDGYSFIVFYDFVFRKPFSFVAAFPPSVASVLIFVDAVGL